MTTITETARDAHYKNGYKVPDGGDYIVHPQPNPRYVNGCNHHVLIRASDGRILGCYSSRAAACKRAQQLGGNTDRSRRLAKGWTTMNARNPELVRSRALARMTQPEREQVEKGSMTTLVSRTTKSIQQDRDKELSDLYKALREGTPGADEAIQEHKCTDYITELKEIVSESAALGVDDRFNTPAMKRYLRKFSLGPVRIRGDYGFSIPKNSYRRAHIEAAWMALPEKKRIQRARQHYRLRERYLDQTGERLIPAEPWELSAIAAALEEFPVPQQEAVHA